MFSGKRLGVLLLISSLATSLHGAATFEWLGDFVPRRVSDDGNAAVGWLYNDGNVEAALWTRSNGIEILGASDAKGVSADGSVVIGQSSGSAYPFRWTRTGGMTHLSTSNGRATGVSADGDVVVGTGSSGAFRWSQPTGLVQLGQIGDYGTVACAVNRAGSIVVGYDAADISEAFRWTDQTGLVSLGTGFFPYDVSDDGSIIVGGTKENSIGTGYAMYWSAAAGAVILPRVESPSVALSHTSPRDQVYGVSSDGLVMVGNIGTLAAGGETAFLWVPDFGIARDFRQMLIQQYGFVSLQSLSLRVASDISADGRIVIGSGTNGAWMATFDSPPVPEPGALALVGVAWSILFHRPGRRKI